MEIQITTKVVSDPQSGSTTTTFVAERGGKQHEAATPTEVVRLVKGATSRTDVSAITAASATAGAEGTLMRKPFGPKKKE